MHCTIYGIFRIHDQTAQSLDLPDSRGLFRRHAPEKSLSAAATLLRGPPPWTLGGAGRRPGLQEVSADGIMFKHSAFDKPEALVDFNIISIHEDLPSGIVSELAHNV